MCILMFRQAFTVFGQGVAEQQKGDHVDTDRQSNNQTGRQAGRQITQQAARQITKQTGMQMTEQAGK